MAGRQDGVSGETCRSGEGGRELEVRCPKRGKRVPAVPMRLRKGQKPAAGSGGGRKPRSGRSAWCRRWSTASKHGLGPAAGWTRGEAQVVQSDRQGLSAVDPGGRLDESRAEQGGGGG